jgi:hypothetical protein
VGLNRSADIVGRRPALMAAALAGLVASLALLTGGRGEAVAANNCPPTVKALSPKAKGFKRYTMLLRVNQLVNVADYANPDRATGGFRAQLRPRDIFVINTRFAKSSPEEWTEIATALRQSFPCNRLVALNGLRPDPSAPGYAYALTDLPALWGLWIDWESGDWNAARKQNMAMPPWTDDFGPTRRRISKRLGSLGAVSAAGVGGVGRRTGIVPAFYRHWDYGLLARAVDRRNARRTGRRGFQVVQSQGYCIPTQVSAFKRLTAHLLRQYRPPPRIVRKRIRGKVRKIKVRVRPRGMVRNLGMEISFSNTPDPSDPRPVASVPPGAAAKCTRVGLKRGNAAFLYWAHPGSIGSLLRTPHMCALRPPC